MRSIQNWLDRFCRKHSKLSIPNLITYIIAGNLVVYVLDLFSFGQCSRLLGFIPRYILQGQVWRLVTFVFVPDAEQNMFFFLLSLYVTWLVGTTLVRQWGHTKFTVYYLSGVLFSVLAGLVLVALMPTLDFPFMSAGYINLALFFAFATLFPDTQFLIFFVIPVKAKWIAWADAIYFVYAIYMYCIIGVPLLSLVPVVAIFNYVLFFGADLLDIIRRMMGRTKHKTSRQTINFKAAQKAAKETKGYLHKCAVCGKTDADDPTAEFRYCSRCNGYHCYCMEHINAHVHVE